MNVLITGSGGFVGRNLIENLKNIRDGKNRTRPGLHIENIYEYSRASTPADLARTCADCDFVFHLAGVNRPKDAAEFQSGNADLTRELLETLESCGNACPVMLSSSVQATLAGRFGDSAYGRSKLAAEELVFAHAAKTGAKALVYRFPNLAGKWCRPNYNSAVATFCHNIAHDLPITVNDPGVELELLFIDDLVEEMLNALEGREHRCEFDGVETVPTETGRYCCAPGSHKATLGRIVELLQEFRDQPKTLLMPRIAPGSLEKKLYSMYLSYLPAEKTVFDLKSNADARGSFTELLKTADHGQFSVNISRPGVTKGQHWHNGKWELFIVVSGHGLIRERRVGSDEVLEFEVSGDRLQAVQMLPGYTHSIVNLSETENLVTLMWANEIFDPAHPDTFYEEV
ncbi:MAG: NAD-dependent epimerase/dehydratase family protein [Oscillospiraceae bacterium]|nr:NAD-dependent epimerase/dehydratase family protein [Oscillospiraceae bacterium]